MKASTPQGGYWFSAAVRESELPHAARCLALVLSSVADSKSGSVRVSYNTLARWSGMGRSTVHRHLQTLVDAGFLKVIPPPLWRQQQGAANQYFTMIPPGFPTTKPPSEGSPAAGLGVVPLASKGSPAAGPSTTGTKPAGRSGSASAPAAEDYYELVVRSGSALLRCNACKAFIDSRDHSENGDGYFCAGCDSEDISFVEIDPTKEHSWLRLDEEGEICAICFKSHS